MELNKKYLATVSYPPNSQACYVRLAMSRPGEELPLSIKATFEGQWRCNLKQGTVVWVKRTDTTDHRKYRIVEVLKNCGEPVVKDCASVQCPTNVKFLLLPRYFQSSKTSNGMHRDTCSKILGTVFGQPFDSGSWDNVIRDNREGFSILCRADQFACFIVLRYEADECINGIKDLKPELHVGAPWVPTLYDVMQEKLGVCRETLESVLSFVDVPNRKMVSAEYVDVTSNYGAGS